MMAEPSISQEHEAACSNLVEHVPIAVDSSFDGEPGYLSGTRVKLLHDISEWSQDASAKPIFWLNGIAGAGKSAIARTVARKLQDSIFLSASFFFKKRETGRGDFSTFFTSIAAQLAQKDNRLLSHIRTVTEADSELLDRALEVQFQKLVLQPLSAIGYCSPLVLVVDDLDECGCDNVQSLLHLFADSKTQHRSTLKLFVACKPERQIWHAIDTIASGVQTAVLHELPPETILEDMALVMQHELSLIRIEHNRVNYKDENLPDNWPGDQKIQALAEMASPLFVYARIMFRFIADRNQGTPSQLLDTILSSRGECLVPQLDRIYTPLLKQTLGGSHASLDDIQRLMTTIAILEAPLSMLSLGRLLGISNTILDSQLDILRSVFHIPASVTSPLRFHHISFQQFLLESNSEYSTNVAPIHERLATNCVRVMNDCLRRNICNLSGPGQDRSSIRPESIDSCIPQELQYACRHWALQLQRASALVEDDGPVFESLRRHFLHWLEALSLIGDAPKSIAILRALQAQLKPTRSKELASFLADALRLLATNMSIIDSNPLQLYSSVLVFAPRSSVLANLFARETIPCMSLRPAQEDDSGQCRQVLEGHRGPVTSAVFSPDSTRLASASDDCTVRLWRLEDGKCTHELRGHTDAVNSVTFLPDGERLASGSLDKTVKLWSIEDGKCLRTLKGHHCSVNEVATSPDSTLLAFAAEKSGYGKIWTWSITNRQYLHELRGPWGPVYSVAFSPDSALLASGAEDGVVRIWSVKDGTCIQSLKGHEDSVFSVLFAPNSDILGSASGDGTVRLWSLSDGRCTRTLESNSFRISISISSDSTLLASASSSCAIQIWNVKDGNCDYQLGGHVNEVNSVAFSPNSKLLASASSDSTVRTWSMDDLHDEPISDIEPIRITRLSPDYKLVVSSSNDGMIQLWDVNDGTCIHRQRIPIESSGFVEEVEFSPDARNLVLVTSFGETCLWSIHDRKDINVLAQAEWNLSAMAFSPDSSILFWGAYDGSIRRMKMDDQSICELPPHASSISACAAAPDCTMFTSGDSDGTIRIWNGERCIHELSLHTGTVLSASFSPDSELLASSSLDKTVRLWSTNDGTCVRQFKCHDNVNSMVFSPDKSHLVSAFADDAVQVWCIKDGETILSRKFPHIGRSRLRFDSGSSTIVSDIARLSIEGLVEGNGGNGLAPRWADCGFSISQDSHWLLWRGEKFLWLPVTVRPTCWEIHEATVAIGSLSGRVVIFKLADKFVEKQEPL